MWKRDYVDCLERTTPTHPRIEEAFAIKQQHLPKRIYKYRQVVPYHLDNLKNDTVWLSSPDSFNDPYDCWLTLPDGVVEASIENAFFNELVKTNELCKVIPLEQIEVAKKSRDPLRTITANIPRADAESCFTRLKGWADLGLATLRGHRRTTKLCSFSEANDCILMWSHYADHHKGFCVEYDLEILNAEHPFRQNLHPVIYSGQLYDLRPYFETLMVPRHHPSLLSMLSVIHKFDGWEYEKEWRMIIEEKAGIDGLNHAAPTPSGVFLGSRFEASKSGEVLAICEQKKIAVYRMRLADDRFGLLPEQFVG